jgi:UDP-3-O-[3-hydroxymyristoyl] glucosamine N-acyltransferase
MRLSLGEIATAVGGTVCGDTSVPVVGVASIEEAEAGDIVFAESPRYLARAEASRASAVMACRQSVSETKPLVLVENPRLAFAQVLALFSPKLAPPIGVDPSAAIGVGAHVAGTASVGAHAVVGDRSAIGERTVIMPGCSIGEDVRIGEDCVLYPNVVVYRSAVIGSRVVIHAGAVIGSDGFGFVRIGDRAHKVPHAGIVEIEDDVEIGANTTIDRAKTGATVIGARTKIDNLVQVAHNVKIGPDCIVASLVGIAGSVRIGRGVVMAGQSGVRDHVTIGDGAVLLGDAKVWSDIAAGAVVSGAPARAHRARLKQLAVVERGEETMRAVRALRAQVAELAMSVGRAEVGEGSAHRAEDP